MKISKIRIKNYRGIKNSGWIEFDRLNAIVGKNDAGKSSILHAINDFYNESKYKIGNSPVFRKGDDMMKQKKRVWMSFNLWEANVFEQYLEEMAAQGWFLESVGGSVMKFHRAEHAKRRYAALLVPGSSSLTGADSWKAEQFRKQCQEAGWNFE